MDGAGGRASTASPTRRRDPADSTDEKEKKTFLLVDARTRIVVSFVSLSSPLSVRGWPLSSRIFQLGCSGGRAMVDIRVGVGASSAGGSCEHKLLA